MATTPRDIGRVPNDPHTRLIHLSNAFGRLLFDMARSPAQQRARSLPDLVQAEVASIVDAVLYSVVQIFDGVTDPLLAGELGLEFALIARLRDPDSGECVAEVELGPEGEGLCMGFAGWIEGDFGAPTGQE